MLSKLSAAQLKILLKVKFKESYMKLLFFNITTLNGWVLGLKPI